MSKLACCLLGACALAASACRSVCRVESGSLTCPHAYDGSGFIGFFSFELGQLTVPPADSAQVDLVYYFDADDCSRGALIGNDDKPGHIFPVGVRSRSELAGLMPPSDGADTVAAIAPVTSDKEGLAFWVKTRNRGFILVRLAAVDEASHADLLSGRTPVVRFDWLEPVRSNSLAPR